MNTQKHHLVPAILFIVFLMLGAVSFVVPKVTETPTPEHIQPTVQETPATTDIYTMEAVVPEAKVSTEGWKTCRNEEYGWELQYPGDWYVYSDGRGTVKGNCQTTLVALNNRVEGIVVNSNQSFGTYRSEYTNVRDLAQSFMNTELIPLRFYMMGGEELVWLISGSSSDLWFFHKGKRFEILGSEKYSDQTETILSTFRFLDTATTSSQ